MFAERTTTSYPSLNRRIALYLCRPDFGIGNANATRRDVVIFASGTREPLTFGPFPADRHHQFTFGDQGPRCSGVFVDNALQIFLGVGQQPS